MNDGDEPARVAESHLNKETNYLFYLCYRQSVYDTKDSILFARFHEK